MGTFIGREVFIARGDRSLRPSRPAISSRDDYADNPAPPHAHDRIAARSRRQSARRGPPPVGRRLRRRTHLPGRDLHLRHDAGGVRMGGRLQPLQRPAGEEPVAGRRRDDRSSRDGSPPAAIDPKPARHQGLREAASARPPLDGERRPASRAGFSGAGSV